MRFTSKIYRTITAITISAYIFCIAGCSSTERMMIIKDELSASDNDKFVEVILNDGTTLRFDESGGHFDLSKTMIVGYSWDKKIVELNAQRVLGAKIERTETDYGLTAFIIFVAIPLATLGILLMIALATWN